MAFRRFMCMRRHFLDYVQSDSGKQLVAASKQLGPGTSTGLEMARKKGLKWYLVLSKEQHSNGQAEPRIRILK
jgi:hypothetical protein